MLFSVVPAVPVAHFDLQGELGVTSSPWMCERETSRRLKAKSAVLGIAIIAVAACRCQLQRWGESGRYQWTRRFTLDLKPCGSFAYPFSITRICIHEKCNVIGADGAIGIARAGIPRIPGCPVGRGGRALLQLAK